MFFFFNHLASKIEIINETIQIKKKDNSLLPIKPNGTFIPKKEAIMVGIEKTIVIPAKNFMITFRLLEIIVP